MTYFDSLNRNLFHSSIFSHSFSFIAHAYSYYLKLVILFLNYERIELNLVFVTVMENQKKAIFIMSRTLAMVKVPRIE